MHPLLALERQLLELLPLPDSDELFNSLNEVLSMLLYDRFLVLHSRLHMTVIITNLKWLMDGPFEAVDSGHLDSHVVNQINGSLMYKVQLV